MWVHDSTEFIVTSIHVFFFEKFQIDETLVLKMFLQRALEVLLLIIILHFATIHFRNFAIFVRFIPLVYELIESLVQKQLKPCFKVLISTFKLHRKDWKFWFGIIIHIHEIKVKNRCNKFIDILSIVKPYKSHFLFIFSLLSFECSPLLLFHEVLLILFIFKIVLFDRIKTNFDSIFITCIRFISKCIKSFSTCLIIIIIKTIQSRSTLILGNCIILISKIIVKKLI